jgi:hypothetical protein
VSGCDTGLPDGLFSNQKYQFGKKIRASDWKMLIYFMAIWNNFWIFGIFYDHSVHFVFIWYIFPVLVSCKTGKEKSGNPAVLG